MLFNILSVVMVYISSCAVAVAIFYLVEKRTTTSSDEQGMLAGLGGIVTIIFMWVMSWQNWWR